MTPAEACQELAAELRRHGVDEEDLDLLLGVAEAAYS
jgi:hypothetical protein